MTVEVIVIPSFLAHLSRILMFDSMMGCPPWQMLSVAAACASSAAAPASTERRNPRPVVIAVLPIGSPVTPGQAADDSALDDLIQDCIQSRLGLKMIASCAEERAKPGDLRKNTRERPQDSPRKTPCGERRRRAPSAGSEIGREGAGREGPAARAGDGASR